MNLYSMMIGMRRLREQAVKERTMSIETPLLQFDDDELNPKPFVYNNEEVIPSNVDLQENQLKDKPSNNLSTCASLKSKEFNPSFEWDIHTLEELNYNDTNDSNVTKTNHNHHAVDNVNEKSIAKKFTTSENYFTTNENDTLAKIENDKFFLNNEKLTQFCYMNTKVKFVNLNNLVENKKSSTLNGDKNDLSSSLMSKDNYINVDTNNTTSKENLLVETSCIQENLKIDNRCNELELHQKFNDKVDDLNDAPKFEGDCNNQDEINEKNDARVFQATILVCTSNEEDANLSFKSMISKGKKQDPMYLYSLDDNEPTIPRFLSILKADKPKNLIQSVINDLSSTKSPHANDVFESESTILVNKCATELIERMDLQNDGEYNNDNRLNYEQSHGTIEVQPNISSKEMDLLQNHDVDNIQQKRFSNNYDTHKKKSSTIFNNELEPKSIEIDDFETKFDKMFQEQFMNNKRRKKKSSMHCEANIKVDGRFYSNDMKNEFPLDSQQNSAYLEKSYPCSLNFKKLPKNEWTFHDIPSKVSIEIQNIGDHNEINHDNYTFDNHGIIVSQEMVEQLENHVKEEWKRHITTVESICKDSKAIEDKSCLCIKDNLVKDDESKYEDYFAHLEYTLMSRMNHNLHPGHQQVGTFDTTCREESEKNLISTFSSNIFQSKDKELSPAQHMVSFYYIIYILIL